MIFSYILLQCLRHRLLRESEGFVGLGVIAFFELMVELGLLVSSVSK